MLYPLVILVWSPLVLCAGASRPLYNGFNTSAIVPDSQDLHACGLDTLIVLAWLLIEAIVVCIGATLIHIWGYQRAFKPRSRYKPPHPLTVRTHGQGHLVARPFSSDATLTIELRIC